MPPPTGCLLPDRDGKTFRYSSWHSSTVPLNQTDLLGCWNLPASIPGLMTLPCRHLRIIGRFGVVPSVHACPARSIYLPPLLPSVGTLRPPPHWIWWGTEGPPGSHPGIPGTPSHSSPLSTLLSATYTSITGGCSRIEAPRRIPPGFPGICPCPRSQSRIVVSKLCILLLHLPHVVRMVPENTVNLSYIFYWLYIFLKIPISD